ncbi:MAG: type II toxin-antitoxin system prevent-host-death family antitoxin [Prochlorococcaceae cyanobacterium]
MSAPRRIVGAFEAKTHLSHLLREVEQGERVTITVRGKAVADLVPCRTQEPEAPEPAVHSMRQFARVRDVADDQIADWIREGRC